MIRALTGVWLRGKYYPKGTEFAQSSSPNPKASPVEVDRGTADGWLRENWAVRVPAVKVEKP